MIIPTKKEYLEVEFKRLKTMVNVVYKEAKNIREGMCLNLFKVNVLVKRMEIFQKQLDILHCHNKYSSEFLKLISKMQECTSKNREIFSKLL